MPTFSLSDGALDTTVNQMKPQRAISYPDKINWSVWWWLPGYDGWGRREKPWKCGRQRPCSEKKKHWVCADCVSMYVCIQEIVGWTGMNYGMFLTLTWTGQRAVSDSCVLGGCVCCLQRAIPRSNMYCVCVCVSCSQQHHREICCVCAYALPTISHTAVSTYFRFRRDDVLQTQVTPATVRVREPNRNGVRPCFRLAGCS